MLVNSADLVLKIIVLLKVTCYLDNVVDVACPVMDRVKFSFLVAALSVGVVFNVVLGLISWWRCYSHNYLLCGALATWLLLLVQGD